MGLYKIATVTPKVKVQISDVLCETMLYGSLFDQIHKQSFIEKMALYINLFRVSQATVKPEELIFEVDPITNDTIIYVRRKL